MTADQIAMLAAMVGSWTPRSGVVDEAVFNDDAPDVVLSVRVRSQSGAKIPIRIRLCRAWLSKVDHDELELYAHRMLSIIEHRNLET